MSIKGKQPNLISPKEGGIAFTAMIIVYLIITFIGQAVLMAFSLTDGAAFSAICGTFSSIAIFAVIFALSKKSKNSVFELCEVKKFQGGYLALSLMLSVSMFFGLGFLNTIVANAIVSLGGKVNSATFPLGSVGEVVIFTTILAVLPAIFEELLFRGIILSSLRGCGIILSSIVSAVFFALYHCSPVQFFYQFVYGVGLALLYNASSSALPCILSHFLNNFTVILLEHLKVDMSGVLFNPTVIAVGIALLAAFFVITMIIAKKRANEEKKLKGVVAEFILPYGFLGGLACLALLIVSTL